MPEPLVGSRAELFLQLNAKACAQIRHELAQVHVQLFDLVLTEGRAVDTIESGVKLNGNKSHGLHGPSFIDHKHRVRAASTYAFPESMRQVELLAHAAAVKAEDDAQIDARSLVIELRPQLQNTLTHAPLHGKAAYVHEEFWYWSIRRDAAFARACTKDDFLYRAYECWSAFLWATPSPCEVKICVRCQVRNRRSLCEIFDFAFQQSQKHMRRLKAMEVEISTRLTLMARRRGAILSEAFRSRMQPLKQLIRMSLLRLSIRWTHAHIEQNLFEFGAKSSPLHVYTFSVSAS
ncbi:hypothetical protein FVE85_5118 [Porphyridium purpureum]|uniref:Uncharacterized protein n=1 Tax=Porphyridium purpureum TaxID=35688 RepID=A0A5J4Z3L4_PORPP|nr:hypothetical protein FVE85_5118 [Porphyridium purpureum]|eukprot:POR4565..scf295_1